MKHHSICRFFLAVFMVSSCPASNVGLSTIEQPVNLGAESDPSRIPLGAVATESNYHYGRGAVITAARPSLHSAMEWKSGTELNQNLASVFGIVMNNHDVPYSPATIHLKDFAIPAYSPYTKEQVLAATIHCLLRSNSGRPKAPIQIKITADSPDDQALIAKFAKDYINSPDNENDPPVEYTKVPGTRLETDPTGVTWVTFPDIKSTTSQPSRPPVMIPFRLGGESGPDDSTWKLLPVWAGTGLNAGASLSIIGMPYPLFYDCFQPGTGSAPEANALFATEPRGSIVSFNVTCDPSATSAVLIGPVTTTETLAATVLALVVSSNPTAEHPLHVKISTMGMAPPWLEAFKACPGWKTENSAISCTFAWDPRTAKLVQGGVPSVSFTRTTNGGIYLEADPKLPETKDTATNEPDVPEKPADTDTP